MATQKPTLFISYRRADHRDFVALIQREFEQRYGEDHVFMDFYIPPFTDFPEYIHERVAECDVMVVIIGPDWVSLLHQRMQSGEDDFVRLEVSSAIQLGKLIAPICIKGARMPSREDLPDDLKSLARKQAGELKDFGRHFSQEVAKIIEALEAELERWSNRKVTPPKIDIDESQSKVSVVNIVEPTPRSPQKRKIGFEHTRLIEIMTNPEIAPPGKAEAGRRLAELGDIRPGVGLTPDGMPDIDWVKIPAGAFIFGGDDKAFRGLPRQKLHLDTFHIARYPVTYTQFQVFVETKDGIQHDRWWEGLAEQQKTPFDQRWPIANHPRENVSWYQAVAFCRWLSAKLGYEVALPTDQQWEKAARGTDGRFYPWGNEYISGYANINETKEKIGPYYLQQTTTVGIYRQGTSPYGVLDMAGNVWEWCLTDFDNINNHNTKGDPRRVGRGGSWYENQVASRSASHLSGDPYYGYNLIGFRVVCH